MTAAERAELRAAGRRAAANLPDLTPEQCRRVAMLLREPVNAFVKAQRRTGGAAR
jgi:hypothetical protein